MHRLSARALCGLPGASPAALAAMFRACEVRLIIAPLSAGYHTTGAAWVAPVKPNLHRLANPRPTLEVESALDIAFGAKGKNLAGKPPQGHKLNQYERVIVNKAKLQGYLEMSRQCSDSACNRYLRYCWVRRRPYIAVNLYGNRVVVDLLPAAGVGKSANPVRVDRCIAGVQQVIDEAKLTTKRGILISNVGSKASSSISAPLGSDASKPDDKKVSDQFSLFVSQRKVALELSQKLWAWFTAEFAELSPEQLAEFKQKKYEVRKAKWESRMIRHLRRVAADPMLVKRVPKGSLDGFIKADAAGLVPK